MNSRKIQEKHTGKLSNAYFISSSGSKISFKTYKRFCLKAGLDTSPVDYEKFEETVINTEGGLLTSEVIYDSSIIKSEILTELQEKGIDVSCDNTAKNIERTDYGYLIEANKCTIKARAVINCTYTNLNTFNRMLDLPAKKFKFDLTLIPIIKWRDGKPPLGITIMDGPFFTILPFGKSGNYLLYHVKHSVSNSMVGEMYPNEWNYLDQVISDYEAYQSFKKIISESCHWLPSIKDAEYLGCLRSIRMVLANQDDNDQRPSLIEKLETTPPFYSIFSGKIDHSLIIARNVAKQVRLDLGLSGLPCM